MANLAVNNYSQNPIFIWNDRFNSQTATYTDTGSGSTLLAGMTIGRVFATNKVMQSLTTARDGSQIPIGVLLADYTIAAGASVDLTFGIAGDVNSSLIIFGGSPADSLSSAVYLNDGSSQIGTVLDILNGAGIIPVKANEMTYRDTQ